MSIDKKDIARMRDEDLKFEKDNKTHKKKSNKPMVHKKHKSRDLDVNHMNVDDFLDYDE